MIKLIYSKDMNLNLPLRPMLFLTINHDLRENIYWPLLYFNPSKNRMYAYKYQNHLKCH